MDTNFTIPFLLFKTICFIISNYVCVFIYMVMYQWVQASIEARGMHPPRAGVTDICKLPDMDAQNQPNSSSLQEQYGLLIHELSL